MMNEDHTLMPYAVKFLKFREKVKKEKKADVRDFIDFLDDLWSFSNNVTCAIHRLQEGKMDKKIKSLKKKVDKGMNSLIKEDKPRDKKIKKCDEMMMKKKKK